MTFRRGTVLFCLLFLQSTIVFGFEDADLRLSPLLGWGFLNVHSESSYGAESDIGMHDFSFGINLSLERQTGNRDLLLGGSLVYQFMTVPFTDNSLLGDNPDLSVSNILVGPSFTYYLDDLIYLSGALGLTILWTSGDDDFLDTSLFGPGFSFGGGYDFPSYGVVQFGIYAHMLLSFVFGDDSAIETDYSGSHISPAAGVSLLF